jgi:gliding motility-associated-like protein
MSASSLIKVNDLPKALVSGVKSICPATAAVAAINIDFSGKSPWVYSCQSPDGNVVVATSTEAQATIWGTKEGVYKVLTVKDANCDGTSEGFGRIQYVPSPVIENVTRTCLPSASAFVVKFDIRNGDASTYSIKGWKGQLQGNVWTSDTINENTTAMLTITDANQCNPIVQSFSKSCSCAADGVMSGGGAICNDKVSKAKIEIALQGQAPWEIDYSVDNGSTIKVSGILVSPYVITTSQNSVFLLQKTRDAHCYGASNGNAKVVYLPSPSVVITGQSSVCKGQDLAHLQIGFTGTAPWAFEVNTPKGHESVSNIFANPFDYTPSAVGDYTLLKANDANCVAQMTDLVGLAKVEAYLPPDTSRLVVYCDNSDNYYIEMALVNGDANSYTVEGVFGTFSNQVWTSTLIPSGTFTTLAISDHKTCTPMVIAGITKTCICPAKATLTGRKIYCDDSLKASVHIALEGTAPWDITYRLNGGTLVQTRSLDKTLVINHIDKTSGFYLVSVKDAKCYGTTSGEGLIVVNRLPTSNISGGGLVCENSPAHMLYMNFTGTPPYQFIYTDGKNKFAKVSNDGLFQIQNPADGDYAIIGLTDANGCVAAQMRGEAHVEVRKFSPIQLAGDTSICQGAYVPIVVHFDNQAQAPYTLTYDGGDGYEIVDHITSNPYQITIHPKQNTFVKLIEAKDKFACVKTVFEDAVQVQVTPIPRLKIINTAPNICSGLTTEIRLLSTANGTENNTQFQWKATTTGKLSGFIAPATGDTIRQALVNNGAALASIVYTVTPFTTTLNQLACYGAPEQTEVSVRRATLPNLGPDAEDACIGNVLHLQAGNFVGGAFTWFVNDSLLSQTNSEMTYTVTPGRSKVWVNYVDICHAPHADTLLIDAKMPVSVSFTSADTCLGMRTQFNPTVLHNDATIDTWTWKYLNAGTMHQTTEANPVEQHSFANAGTQKVLLEGYRNGCKLGDTTLQLIISNCDFSITNTFTPNGDGKNDIWEIKGIERYPNANIVIMNRWGMIVHEMPGSQLPWNGNNDKGEALEAGVYYYIITLNKVKESSEIIQGHVNLLISNND